MRKTTNTACGGNGGGVERRGAERGRAGRGQPLHDRRRAGALPNPYRPLRFTGRGTGSEANGPFDGAQFHIRLYPGGHLEKDKGCVSAFLMYTGHRDGVRAVFTFVATHSGLPRCELL